MELGIYTFAEVGEDPVTGQVIEPAQRLKNLLEEIELADQVGLDVFGVGEHHRADFAVSAPAIVLAAAAARTKNIRLSSAVSVLSSDDPVRVFQQFATIDLLSGGRAEIMAGRGSFIESFPLFGYDLQDYDDLFTEKLSLLLDIRDNVEVTWEGKLRASLNGQAVYPRPVQNPIPVWIASGGTPQSAARAASLGLPMALAIIGGEPKRFAPVVELYRKVVEQVGQDPSKIPVSINSHGYIADTSQQALDEAFPPFAATMNRIGRERGWSPINREHFEAGCGPEGAQLVGSPQQVIDKILYEHELFGHQRTLIQFSVGPMPHRQIMHSIELFGTKVAPAVRRALPATP